MSLITVFARSGLARLPVDGDDGNQNEIIEGPTHLDEPHWEAGQYYYIEGYWNGEQSRHIFEILSRLTIDPGVLIVIERNHCLIDVGSGGVVHAEGSEGTEEEPGEIIFEAADEIDDWFGFRFGFDEIGAPDEYRASEKRGFGADLGPYRPA